MLRHDRPAPPHDEQPAGPQQDFNNPTPSSAQGPTMGLPTSSSMSTMLDRRRESIAANSSLRSHPFLATNNAVGQLADDGDGTSHPHLPRRFPNISRRADGPPPAASSGTGSPPQLSPGLNHLQEQPEQLTPGRATPSRAHHRTLSESVATLSTPPRRALGLVRKLSFRSRERNPAATVEARNYVQQAPSGDDALEELSKDAEHDIGPSKSGLVRSASVATSRPTRRVRSPRKSSDQPRTAAFDEPTMPAGRDMSAQQAPELPEWQRAQPPQLAESSGSAAPRHFLPRSPPRSSSLQPIIGSPANSPQKPTASSSRTAETEWKAKLAALPLPDLPPTSPTRPGNNGGPRPPPRRLNKPSAVEDDSRGEGGHAMAGSSTLTPSTSNAARSRQRNGSANRSVQAATLTNSSGPPVFSAYASSNPRTLRSSRPHHHSQRSTTDHQLPPISPMVFDVPGIMTDRPPLPPTPRRPSEQSGMNNGSTTTMLDRPSPLPSQPVIHAPQPVAPNRHSPIPGSHHAPAASWSAGNRIIGAHSSVPDLGRIDSPPSHPSPRAPRVASADSIPGHKGTDSPHPAARTPVPECTVTPTLPGAFPPSEHESALPDFEPGRYPSPGTATFGNVRGHRRNEKQPSQVYGDPRTTSLAAAAEARLSPGGDGGEYKLRRTYNLTPGLERGGMRPRKTGFPKDDLQKWLQESRC